MYQIKCPSCGAESKLILSETTYNGPFRCYSCHTTLRVQIRDKQVVSLQPMTDAEMAQQQEEEKRRKEIEELKAKFRRPQG